MAGDWMAGLREIYEMVLAVMILLMFCHFVGLDIVCLDFIRLN